MLKIVAERAQIQYIIPCVPKVIQIAIARANMMDSANEGQYEVRDSRYCRFQRLTLGSGETERRVFCPKG